MLPESPLESEYAYTGRAMADLRVREACQGLTNRDAG